MRITDIKCYAIKSGDTGAPLPINGKVTLDPNKPGFGLELKRELHAPFKCQ